MTANGHGDLPGEQGNANAVDATGSGQKAATGHVESGIDPRIATGLLESGSECDATGSGPKTVTGNAVTARGWTATKTSPASDALDRLTMSGKQSENDGTGHESWPTESGVYDPSLSLDPKIEKHGRIENGSGPPKTLPTHHVAERVVMSGERQPRERRGAAADEQLPPSQLPKEPRRQKRAPDERPETFPPLSLDLGRAGGEEASRDAAQGASRDPSLLACPPEGREEEEASGRKTYEEVPARGEVAAAVGSVPEGREERFRSL